MKGRILIIVTVFIGLNSIWAQSYIPFPDSNATWCDEREDNGFPPHYYHSFYRTNGKCDIHDTIYTIISDHLENNIGYLREENKKVYFRFGPDIPEFILYDFDLEAGDTISLYQMHSGNFEDGWIVDIDSILIGSEYHRRYYIETFDWISIQFIEGVGSDLGLLYFDIPWVDIWGDLKCFSLNDTIFDTEGLGGTSPGNCWLYIGFQEEQREQIVIYPNPASDFIHLDYNKDCWLELTNMMGTVLCQSYSGSLYVRDLKDGIYLLKVYSETDELLKQVKILKFNAR